MKNSELAALDIALATGAHAMYARLLSQDEKKLIADLRSTDELVAFLRRTSGWGGAAADMPPSGVTDKQFAFEIERAVYSEYERLYRFAESTAKDFLIFIALHVKCRAILNALRRLGTPGTKAEDDPLPPFFHTLPGYNIDRLMTVNTYDELIDAGGGGIYGDTLRLLERDPVSGLPRFAEAADLLEDRYYSAMSDFLSARYSGPDKQRLTELIGFRADLLNVSYLLRLRRFNTPPDKAHALLLPISGGLSRKTEDEILAAESDEAAFALLLSTRLGKYFKGLSVSEPGNFVRAAEAAYFRKIIHGEPSLSVAYAFMVLNEAEAGMLKRVFVALQYGLNPEIYM
ncbi:MAG: V-type ATPase subunit [Oscillospiraceae bacterium]